MHRERGKKPYVHMFHGFVWILHYMPCRCHAFICDIYVWVEMHEQQVQIK